MDKALILSLLPLFALCILIGLVAMHIRKGKKLDVRLEGLGIKFSLQSEDKGGSNDPMG